MRSISEIQSDCKAAFERRDATTLWALAEEIERHHDPEAQAHAQNQFGKACRLRGDFDAAVTFHLRALSLFDDLQNKKYVCSSHIELSYDLREGGDGALAGEHAERAVLLAEELGDQALMAWSRNCLANLYQHRHDHEGAIREYTNALKILESIGHLDAAARTMVNLALVHTDLGDFSQALDLYRRAYALFKQAGAPFPIAKVAGLMGNVVSSMGDFPQALEYYDESLQIFEQHGMLFGVASTLMNIGNTYTSTDDLEKALEALNRSMQIIEEIGDPHASAHVMQLIGIVYSHDHQYEKAERYLTNALAASRSLHQTDLEQHGLLQLSGLFIKQDRWNEAETHVDDLSAYDLSNPFLEAGYNIRRGEIRLHHADHAAAEHHFLAALEIAQRHHYRAVEMQVQECLRDLAVLKGDLQAYITYNEHYTALHDEVKGGRAQLRIAMRAKEKEIELARHERELERMKGERLETSLQRQQQLLSSYANSLVRQTELADELRSTILTMIKQSVSSDGAVESIRNTLADQPSASSNWQRFFVQFRNVFPDFEADLRLRVPTLSPTELKVCCLVAMGMQTRDIATLLFVSERTIDIHRGTIRKKLGVDRQTDLRTALLVATVA